MTHLHTSSTESGRRLETLGSAAAGIAHDINNQLTLILNHLAVWDLDGVRDAANRCSALTASLLAFCRGESIVLQAVDLSVFLRDFTGQLTLPGGVRLLTELPPHGSTVQADTAAVARVLTNLIGNACDAMKGEGTLRIAVLGSTIEIHDSGPGIAPEHLERIFAPFFTTKGSRGTGLGLAIVREIMRQHGGSATVTSKPGRGACFRLRFRQ